jgi:hypothetical protein
MKLPKALLQEAGKRTQDLEMILTVPDGWLVPPINQGSCNYSYLIFGVSD